MNQRRFVSLLLLSAATVLGLKAWLNVRETLDAGRPSGQTSTR